MLKNDREKSGGINDFDCVKHVYCMDTSEIFAIEIFKDDLFKLISIDRPENELLVRPEILQAGYMPIELISSKHVISYEGSEVLSQIQTVLLKNPGGVH